MRTSEMRQTSSNAQGKESGRRVFSGIQPSGDVQLGNYLGAIKGWVERQAEKTNFFCIVDLPLDPSLDGTADS